MISSACARPRPEEAPPSSEMLGLTFPARLFDDNFAIPAESEFHLFARVHPEPLADRFRQRDLSLAGDRISHGAEPYSVSVE